VEQTKLDHERQLSRKAAADGFWPTTALENQRLIGCNHCIHFIQLAESKCFCIGQQLPNSDAQPQAPTKPHCVQYSHPSFLMTAWAPQSGHFLPAITLAPMAGAGVGSGTSGSGKGICSAVP
jgi:hypothetical protein